MIEKAFDCTISRTGRCVQGDGHFSDENEDLSERTDKHFFLMFDVLPYITITQVKTPF